MRLVKVKRERGEEEISSSSEEEEDEYEPDLDLEADFPQGKELDVLLYMLMTGQLQASAALLCT